YEKEIKADPQQSKPNYSFNEWKEESEVVQGSNQVRFYLPASLRLGLDCRLSGPWYLGLHYAQNLRSTHKLENVYLPSAFTCVLRRETRQFTFAFPLRVVPSSRTFCQGVLAQCGPFFIGMDNLLLPFQKRTYSDRKSTRLNSSHVKISYA